VIVLYPIVLGAALIISSQRTRTSRGGWQWFGAWTVAGALMTFSFLTGFSIGLFLLPLAAGATLWVARQAPGAFDGIGFFAGVAAILLLVSLVNSATGDGWVFAGLIIGLGAVAAYSAVPDARLQLRR
jgi:hypothetical protein